MSHSDYSQLMNKAIHCVVDNEGVQNYVGALPDYVNEQVVLTVRHPVSKATLAELAKRVGAGRVRLETAPIAGKAPIVHTSVNGSVRGSAVRKMGQLRPLRLAQKYR